MPHKAGESFFEEKRHWSLRKDRILRSYVTAYLPKVMHLGRPITLVDGFAGPGRFANNEPGSPLILCQVVEDTMSKNLASPQPVRIICIEADLTLAGRLETVLESYNFAEARQATFAEQVDALVVDTAQRTVFLYLDPFTVEGIEWASLERLAAGLSQGQSVELLLNVNTASFARRGRQALSLQPPEAEGVEEEVDIPFRSPASVEKLNAVVGGDWWIPILQRQEAFAVELESIENEFISRLGRLFNEVGSHRLFREPHHTVPGYTLLFATRHPDGLRLMNDEFVKSQTTLADQAASSTGPTLFETRPETLVPDLGPLRHDILWAAYKQTNREEVVLKIIRKHFGKFTQKTIREVIRTLCKSGDMSFHSPTGRLNNQSELKAITLDSP